jgi:hypothetical protein
MRADSSSPTPECIAEGLKRTIKNGARAAELDAYARSLVDLLYPLDEYLGLSNLERAAEAETSIRLACEALEGPTGQALLVLLGLAPGTAGATLERRQYLAGGTLRQSNIQADTVRRPYIRRRLLNSLAVELYRQCIVRQAA